MRPIIKRPITKLFDFIITIALFFLEKSFIKYINVTIYCMVKNFLAWNNNKDEKVARLFDKKSFKPVKN